MVKAAQSRPFYQGTGFTASQSGAVSRGKFSTSTLPQETKPATQRQQRIDEQDEEEEAAIDDSAQNQEQNQHLQPQQHSVSILWPPLYPVGCSMFEGGSQESQKNDDSEEEQDQEN